MCDGAGHVYLGHSAVTDPILYREQYKSNCTGHCQTGSLAGVAHPLEWNTDVPRAAPWEQKPLLDYTEKSCFDLRTLSTGTQCQQVNGILSYTFVYVIYLCLNGRPSDPLTITYAFCSYVCHHTFGATLLAVRGVRKVTTGITGLWRRSVQSDAAFWFFDVGSSYPVLASGHKGKFVHLPTGNVSWV